SDNRPFYFWQMTIPYAWTFLVAPSVAMISLVVMGTNMLSTYWYQYQIQYHYALVIVPALAMGTVWAVAKVAEQWRPLVVGLVLCTSLWCGWQWGALPFSQHLPYAWAPSHPVAVDSREIITYIPDGASVSAQYSISAHIDRRQQIYMFPNPFSTQLYGPDDSISGKRLPQAETVQYVVLPATLEPANQLVWDKESPAFTLVHSNQWWRLFERTSLIGKP
ncbi:MAG: hypothetical protein JWN99_1632, partial [Ilumatobacteraceae bacterium]|nr:hypothetical protein [Ilumatobacteraceae bacterium]